MRHISLLQSWRVPVVFSMIAIGFLWTPPLRSDPTTANPPFTIFIDLDKTVIHSLRGADDRAIDNMKEQGEQIIHLRGGYTYRVGKGWAENLQSLSKIPNVKIVVFSANVDDRRNHDVVSAITLPDGRNANEVVSQVLSFQHTDHPQEFSFARKGTSFYKGLLVQKRDLERRQRELATETDNFNIRRDEARRPASFDAPTEEIKTEYQSKLSQIDKAIARVKDRLQAFENEVSKIDDKYAQYDFYSDNKEQIDGLEHLARTLPEQRRKLVRDFDFEVSRGTIRDEYRQLTGNPKAPMPTHDQLVKAKSEAGEEAAARFSDLLGKLGRHERDQQASRKGLEYDQHVLSTEASDLGTQIKDVHADVESFVKKQPADPRMQGVAKKNLSTQGPADTGNSILIDDNVTNSIAGQEKSLLYVTNSTKSGEAARIRGLIERSRQIAQQKGISVADAMDSLQWHRGGTDSLDFNTAKADSPEIYALGEELLRRENPRFSIPPRDISLRNPNLDFDNVESEDLANIKSYLKALDPPAATPAPAAIIEEAPAVAAAATAGEPTHTKAVIGIFGDTHGDLAATDKVLKKFKEMGVTHIIGTGDFIEWEGPTRLRETLAKITPATGVPKDHIFLLPGNWEHESYYPEEDMNKVMREYGNLVVDDYKKHGFVEIGGDKIMVSHFPLHEIPRNLLPPPQFIKPPMNRMGLKEGGRNGPGPIIPQPGTQFHILEAVGTGIYPTDDVKFEIFAHTHINGDFVDPKTGKLAVNVGTLSNRKSPAEPNSFAIYDANEDQLNFFDAAKDNALIRTVKVPTSQTSAETARCFEQARESLIH